MKARTAALALCTAAVSGYFIWSRSGRIVPGEVGPLYLEAVAEYGEDRGRGNLLGIQTYMVPHDYASRETFYGKLNGYMAEARARGWLTPRTIVVFPEFLGTWLVLQGEKTDAFAAEDSQTALKQVVLADLPAFLRYLPFAAADDAVKYSLFRMKAAGMAATYDAVFSRLAREYGVTIVAGSIVLPGPEVVDGHLHIHDGPLYNVSVVYRADGSPYEPVVRKAFPTPEETPFVAAGNETDLPVFDTPAGKLGVLICADSWFPGPYEVLKQQGVELIAVPSYAATDDHWDKAWGGYMRLPNAATQQGTPTPEDVLSGDSAELSSREAWLKHAMAGRLPSSGARAGVNVFLRGCLWDLGADGHTIMVLNGSAAGSGGSTGSANDGQKVFEGEHVEGAALANLWL